MVSSSVTYLANFLLSSGLSISAENITAAEMRAFIVFLQERPSYAQHPLVRPQSHGLSENSINCYLRSIRAFWSWLVREGFIQNNPFQRVGIPKAAQKGIRPFSNDQLQALLQVIPADTAEGYRDYAIVLTLLDTGIRLSELSGLRLKDIDLQEKLLRVKGKGNKERTVPVGKVVQQVLWRYINWNRPDQVLIKWDYVFLTQDGRAMTKNRIEARIKKYGVKAGIVGVRCSPHTFRHTAAINFLRNGGNVFSLQRLLGHNSLEMTRRYCEIADIDVQIAHATASPVDNLAHVSHWKRQRKICPSKQRNTR